METAHRRSARTDDRVDPAILDADCNAVLDTIETGGIAIIPTCLTYAIIGYRAEAIAAIFAAKAENACGAGQAGQAQGYVVEANELLHPASRDFLAASPANK